MRFLLALAVTTFLLTGSQNSLADVREWEWDFSGFATIAAGRTNRDDLTYMNYDGDWSVDSDSMIGLQLVVEPMDRFSITGQLAARGFTFDTDIADYEVETEWLFASFELFESSRLRIGRLRSAHQYYSDSLEVGYSYVWARPPVEAYPFVLSPFTHYDGVDYSFNFYSEDFDSEVKLVAGKAEGNFLSNDIDLDRVWGFTLLSRWETFTLRYAFLDHTVDFYIPFYETLIENLEQAAEINPDYNDVAHQYHLENGRMRYHSLAAEWNVIGWNILAERYEFEPPDKQLNNRQRGWYISFAYPIGAFTPYFVTGAYKSIMGKEMYDLVDEVYEDSNADLNTALDFLLAIPPGFRPPDYDQQVQTVSGLITGLTSLRDYSYQGIALYEVSQRSYTTGVRWDFHAQAAVKAELQYAEFARRSTGHYIGKIIEENKQADPNDAMSLTLVLDMVF